MPCAQGAATIGSRIVRTIRELGVATHQAKVAHPL